MGHCAQVGDGMEDGDTLCTAFPFVCTPNDFQDLSAVMQTFPPSSSTYHEFFRALLYAHREWEKRRTRTIPARPSTRERRRKAVSLYLLSQCLTLLTDAALQAALCGL